MEPTSRAEAELAASSRFFCGGLDTHILYEREDGKKPWRAEIPASDEEKQESSAAVLDFKRQYVLADMTLQVEGLIARRTVGRH